jgi:cytochrome c
MSARQADTRLALKQATAVAQTHHGDIEVGAQPLKDTAVKKLSSLVAVLALAGAWSAMPALASQQLATKSGCFACHMPDRKLVGPSYKEIAAKYKGRADAVAFLSKRVRDGGPGTWGKVPMAPTDAKRLPDADLKTLVTWILATP